MLVKEGASAAPAATDTAATAGATGAAPDEKTAAVATDTKATAAADTKATGSLLGDAADAEKPADDAKDAAAKAEAELELKFPEGFQVDEAGLKEFKAIAKEVGLDSAKAQKVADLYAKIEGSRAQLQADAFAKQTAEWVETLKKDKDFGGEKFEANKQLLGRAMKQFGSPELQRVLNESGLGNHPELVKAFHRVGLAMQEDSIGTAHGGTKATPSNSDEALHRALYPTMFTRE